MKSHFRLLILAALLFGLMTSAISAQAAPTRISFAAGTTSSTIQGSVNASQTVEYVLGAGQGQTMNVSVLQVANQIPPANVFLTITDAYGRALLTLNAYQTAWSGVLPTTQDYKIQVVNLGAATTFRLEVSIPSEIRFAPGGTSATLRGNVNLTRANEYLFSARANQWITLTIVSPYDNVRLTLVDANGNPLLRAAGMPTNTWSGTLPLTGRYYLSVQQLQGTSGTNYTLTMSIVN